MSRYEGDLEACSPQERQKLARLGRTLATLLYRWSGGLPGKDWSCLTLDGAQLPQADLTGKDFHGTSLRSANLSNSVFVDADFSAADLSGVRLEETGEVRSLSVTGNLDGFFAGYADGSIRLWSFDTSSHRESPIVCSVPSAMSRETGRDAPIQIRLFPVTGFACTIASAALCSNAIEDRYEECAAFDMLRRYLSVTLHEMGVVAVARANGSESEVCLFEFLAMALRRAEHLRAHGDVHAL